MNNMNKLIKLTMLTALMMGGYAQASIEAGFYKGNFKNEHGKNSGESRIFIENVEVDRVPVSYGLIMNLGGFLDTKTISASVFRIEELPDGSQAWIRVSEKQSGLIGSNENQEALYNVSLVKDGCTKTLNFVPTDYAVSLGCKMELVAKKRNGQSWKTLPTDGEIFVRSEGRQKTTVSATQINGRYYVSDQLKNGSANVSEVIPNVGVIRSESLNSESEDGRSMDRQITAMITIIHRSILGDRLKIVKLSATGCFDQTSTLIAK